MSAEVELRMLEGEWHECASLVNCLSQLVVQFLN